MASCTHGNGRALCFECFKAGMERTRARRAAWTQRELPLEPPTATPRSARSRSRNSRIGATCSSTWCRLPRKRA